MTSFHESKGTFLEAPCKAFWFAPGEAYHQGNWHVNNKSDVLYILRAASGTKRAKKRLALPVQAAFFRPRRTKAPRERQHNKIDINLK